MNLMNNTNSKPIIIACDHGYGWNTPWYSQES